MTTNLNPKSLLLKLSFVVILGLCSSSLSGQSWSAEEKNLSTIIQSGIKSQVEITDLVAQWRKFKEEYGTYPNLPFNENNIIEYTFIYENNLDKAIVYDRILEWASINFGSLSAVLHYENFESGKIILKGFFEVLYVGDFMGGFWGNKIVERTATAKARQTYVLTIKDNKLKVQIIDIDFVIKYGGYFSGTIYVPAEDISLSINSLYPISNSEKLYWKSNLNRLNEVNTRINDLSNSLNEYINYYYKDYDF
jgi:hypothetical protein